MSNRFTKLLTAAVLIGTPATALASPRTLPSGAPACGNTMGKGGYRDGCTAEERAAWRAEVARQDARERAHERARRIAAKQRGRERASAKAVTEIVKLASAVIAPGARS